MRWDAQSVAVDDGALPGLTRAGLVRSIRSPEFDGVTFHEVLCKSALNRVPAESGMPFRWTVNPTRGCTHQCKYCFARPTHEYLDLSAGSDFDSEIVVKTNIVPVLRRELRRASWRRENVALGTNTDPYQRAEGRYKLMPGIISALAESGTPFSVLTKGTLLRRDLPLLSAVSRHVDVSLGVSLAMLDEELQQSVEPGTPTPRARLSLIRAIREAGMPCGVMIAPVIPYLTDSAQQLDDLLGAVSEAGATKVTVLPMHLRGSTRDVFMNWLGEQHPALIRRYRAVYGRGAYASTDYQEWLRARVAPLVRKHCLGAKRSSGDCEPRIGKDRRAVHPATALTLF
ncbi:Rv2578c family radical SAM protein [Hoyosella subflava]|uniref:Rv2578c family radical SAM protein n=1 Tax=Hoyosella subflava TaxID=639313 RepID=UPI00059CEA07|nr:Rv2578c family radical SAM protein [Hoyosella subflava]